MVNQEEETNNLINITKQKQNANKIEIISYKYSPSYEILIDTTNIDLDATEYNIKIKVIKDNIEHIYLLKFFKFINKEYDIPQDIYLWNRPGLFLENERIVIGEKEISTLTITEYINIIKNKILESKLIREKSWHIEKSEIDKYHFDKINVEIKKYNLYKINMSRKTNNLPTLNYDIMRKDLYDQTLINRYFNII